MILTVALSVAGTLAATHFAPIAWKWLNIRKPRLADQLRSIETKAEEVLAPVQKEATMISDVVQQKLAHLGAALSSLKSRAETAEAALPAKQAELDAANAHIAELTSQLATEAANHADDVGAVSALADQAG